MSTELAVVLPVYNEGEAVEPVLRALAGQIKTPHELVVVLRLRRRHHRPGHRTASRARFRSSAASERPRSRLPERHEGRHRGTSAPFVLISMADGSDEPHIVDPMV